jgi:hypothetical protein
MSDFSTFCETVKIDAATGCINLIILLKGFRPFYYNTDEAEPEVIYGKEAIHRQNRMPAMRMQRGTVSFSRRDAGTLR